MTRRNWSAFRSSWASPSSRDTHNTNPHSTRGTRSIARLQGQSSLLDRVREAYGSILAARQAGAQLVGHRATVIVAHAGTLVRADRWLSGRPLRSPAGARART